MSDKLRPGQRMWEVWSEGWAANEGRSPAAFHGIFPGCSFADACQTWVDTKVRESERFHFSREHLTFWGCRLFDNERAARKSFG